MRHCNTEHNLLSTVYGWNWSHSAQFLYHWVGGGGGEKWERSQEGEWCKGERSRGEKSQTFIPSNRAPPPPFLFLSFYLFAFVAALFHLLPLQTLKPPYRSTWAITVPGRSTKNMNVYHSATTCTNLCSCVCLLDRVRRDTRPLTGPTSSSSDSPSSES